GAFVIATSHLSPLKAFVQEAEGMTNAAMEYKDRPTYRLMMGVPGESSALEVAQSLGFPAEILTRARDYLNPDWLNLADLLKELTAEVDETRRLRLALARDGQAAEARRRAWEEKTARLAQYERDEQRRIRAEQEALLLKTRREVENLVRQIRESQASHTAIKQAKDYVETQLRHLARSESETPDVRTQAPGVDASGKLGPGSSVRSRTFGREGTIVQLLGDEATVAFGHVRMRLKLADLELLSSPLPPEAPVPEELDEEFDPRLSLRGLTRAEAQEQLERFLDRAMAAGARRLSILHGKGTGALRKMLWERLRRDERVSEVRLGDPNEGGSGITFVTLKESA
ncbi:MAG: Smr/MutS family protein, partial [candidate division WOR-3 bacterium]